MCQRRRQTGGGDGSGMETEEEQGGADDDVRMLSFEQLRMVLYAPRLSLMPINACH